MAFQGLHHLGRVRGIEHRPHQQQAYLRIHGVQGSQWLQREEHVFHRPDAGGKQEGEGRAPPPGHGMRGKLHPLGNHHGALLQARQVLRQAPLHAGMESYQTGGAAQGPMDLQAALVGERLVHVGPGKGYQVRDRQGLRQGVRHPAPVIAVEGVQQLRGEPLQTLQDFLARDLIHRKDPHLAAESPQMPLDAPDRHGVAALHRVVIGCNNSDAHKRPLV